MVLYTDKSECYGCSACMNACPHGAITMTADKEGFLYPSIDTSLCINCGVCQQKCQIHHPPKKSDEPVAVYAAKNRNEEIRALSTSGGLFSVFAEEAIKRNGSVYGAAYDEEFSVCHSCAESGDDYSKFRGSKYCQSDLGTTYSEIKQKLALNKFVLFSGTPCQIAGLKTFLGSAADDENLFLLEIICHGVPSPLMWREHIALLEKTRKSKVSAYKNRSKVAGWHGHNEHVFFENGKNEYKTKLSQNHKDLFYAHLIIRPSCYECAYAGTPRIADISIADYWGIEQCMPEFDDNKGTSLILINSKKGDDLFKCIMDKIEYRESTLEDAFRDNHKKPAKMNVNRDKFWKDYHDNGYLYVLKKYSAYTPIGKAKRQAKFAAKKITKVMGLYSIIHKYTQRKYQGETYK